MEGSRSLTRREFDDVIRRASELAAAESDGGEGALAESELIRIAGEVGLPERHVRRALAELRGGGGVRSGGGPIEKLFGPEYVGASRVVPGATPTLAGRMDSFLVGGRLLQSVRRTDRLLQYRPAVDWASQIARAASATSRRYYVAAARSVEVRLEEVDPERTLVEIEVDPGTRSDAVGGAVAGVVVGAAAGVGAAFALAPMVPVAIAVAGGVLLTVALGAGTASWVGSRQRRKLRDVLAEVEGILDTLESGNHLEPPPASWRKWVRRHFHDMANDILVTKDE